MGEIVHIRKNDGWEVYILKIVLPVKDSLPHTIYSDLCHCKPFWEDGILVHNAFDGRHRFEKAEDAK